MWRGAESKECQSDVKQTVNVDGLFVRLVQGISGTRLL